MRNSSKDSYSKMLEIRCKMNGSNSKLKKRCKYGHPGIGLPNAQTAQEKTGTNLHPLLTILGWHRPQEHWEQCKMN
jgi:hypothetical protein